VECDIKHLSSYYKEVKSRVLKVVDKCEVGKIKDVFTKHFLQEE